MARPQSYNAHWELCQRARLCKCRQNHRAYNTDLALSLHTQCQILQRHGDSRHREVHQAQNPCQVATMNLTRHAALFPTLTSIQSFTARVVPVMTLIFCPPDGGARSTLGVTLSQHPGGGRAVCSCPATRALRTTATCPAVQTSILGTPMPAVHTTLNGPMLLCTQLRECTAKMMHSLDNPQSTWGAF